MIIIVAPWQDPKAPKDGFTSRVGYVDEIFSKEKRVYLWLDSKLKIFKPILYTVRPNIQRVYANPWNPIHIAWIIKLSFKADLCYFHSVYKTLKLFYLLFMKKCIVDLHGVAPEELEMMGDHRQSKLLSITERFAVRYAYRVISVTKVMAKYVQNKYPSQKINFIILPIFDNKRQVKKPEEIKNLLEKKKLPMVYSGSASIWQAIDKMVDLIKSTSSKYSYTILSTDSETFKQRIKNKEVRILSVSKKEVYRHYAKNLFGIVIREKNIVNTVSCPTKLIEYMASSVLPIVEYTSIGDFEKLGYKYLTAEDIKAGKIPNFKKIQEMLSYNQKIIDKYLQMTENGVKELRKLLDK